MCGCKAVSLTLTRDRSNNLLKGRATARPFTPLWRSRLAASYEAARFRTISPLGATATWDCTIRKPTTGQTRSAYSPSVCISGRHEPRCLMCRSVLQQFYLRLLRLLREQMPATKA